MPKVFFDKMSLKENIDFIKDIFNNRNSILDTYTYTISLFPELKEIDLNSSKDVINEKITEIVTKYYNNYDKFEDDIDRYSRIWNMYNDSFFDKLTTYLDCSWPVEHNIIHVTVGIIPVCPRYLDDFSFSVHDGLNDDQLIETCAHELCHFLWFEKWKELYPDCPRKEYESPSIVWEYSEMVVDPILNSSKISRVFNNKKTRYCYDYFYNIYDKDDLLMNKLTKIYNDNDISIERKIEKGYKYIKSFKSNNTKKVPL